MSALRPDASMRFERCVQRQREQNDASTKRTAIGSYWVKLVVMITVPSPKSGAATTAARINRSAVSGAAPARP
jgi:hypothetical protein